MPIRAVDAITFIEVHRVGHIGQVIARPSHIGMQIFDVNMKLPGDSGKLPGSGGNYKRFYQIIVNVCV